MSNVGAVEYFDNVLELIGNTPLVRLHVADDLPATVLAKVEFVNPGGSVKDRIAGRMVDEAEKADLIRPGGVIVEPTSGNTGVGLAMVAQRRGYRCVFVCPDKVSDDKQNVLKAYGAEVVVCPSAVPPEHPDSYYSVSDRLVREIEGAWKPDQYSNPANPRSHYETTGPEIWRQTDGKISHFVAGIGTGGTISGTGRYLREMAAQAQKALHIIGADPEGSVFSGGSVRPYLVEGVGEDLWPETYDRTICDEVIAVNDQESFDMARRLAREEGLLVGGSAGMAVVAALRVAERSDPDDVVVVLLPDSGRGYLSKIFDDSWMRTYGFLGPTQGSTIGDVLLRKSGAMPSLVHTHPGNTIADAIATMRQYDVSQLPVVRAEPPIVAAEVAGSVTERQLTQALFADEASLTDKVESFMDVPFPMLGSGSSVTDAAAVLKDNDALLVLDYGKPTGVLTRKDLLEFIAEE